MNTLSLENIGISNISNPIEITNGFDNLSQLLLNKSLVTVMGKSYRLAEIEFYYSNKFHDDKFTHKSAEQQRKGYWYIHKNEKGILKSGKHKGIDITFGCKAEDSFGGILLRAMIDIDTNEYIYGPSKLVDQIILKSGKVNINDIANLVSQKVVENNPLSVSIMQKELPQVTVYNCPRWGLENTKKTWITEERHKYEQAFYRYFIFPFQKHAGKEKQIMSSWKEKHIFSDEEILRIFGRKSVANF